MVSRFFNEVYYKMASLFSLRPISFNHLFYSSCCLPLNCFLNIFIQDIECITLDNRIPLFFAVLELLLFDHCKLEHYSGILFLEFEAYFIENYTIVPKHVTFVIVASNLASLFRSMILLYYR